MTTTPNTPNATILDLSALTETEIRALGAGETIDKLTALAMGWQSVGDSQGWAFRSPGGRVLYVPRQGPHEAHNDGTFAPSRDWRSAGEVIERFRLSLGWDVYGKEWEAGYHASDGDTTCFANADTPTLAICRCVLLGKKRGDL